MCSRGEIKVYIVGKKSRCMYEGRYQASNICCLTPTFYDVMATSRGSSHGLEKPPQSLLARLLTPLFVPLKSTR